MHLNPGERGRPPPCPPPGSYGSHVFGYDFQEGSSGEVVVEDDVFTASDREQPSHERNSQRRKFIR